MPAEGNRKIPLVIGVTGHRELAEADVPAIEQAVASILERYRDEYPSTPFLLLTSLAEGADRLVARIAREKFRAETLAVLPMPEEEYVKDFETPESREEFVRMRGRALEAFAVECGVASRAEHYAAASMWIATRAQVVIALWDGEPTEKIGGTAWFIRERAALLENLAAQISPHDFTAYGPIHVVHTPRAIAGGAGKIRVIEPPAAAIDAVHENEKRRGFFEAIAHLLTPTHPAPHGELYRDTFRRVEKMNADIEKVQDAQVTKNEEWFFQPDPARPLTAGLRRVRSIFAALDFLAIRYQARLRVLLLRLCGLAGAAALCFEFYAHYVHGKYGWGEFRHGVVLLFPVLFLLALWVNRNASKHDYQNRFQDYRAVAEGLRVQFFWTLAGIALPAAGGYEGRQRRELEGIRSAVFVAHVLAGPPQCGDAGLADARRQWVGEQAKYFERAMKKNRVRVVRIEWSMTFALLAGLSLVLVAGVGAMILHAEVWTFVFLGAGGLLLVSALLHFYNEKNAYAEHMRQYEAMARIFKKGGDAMEACLANPDAASRTRARKILIELGHEALTENGDWVLTHRSRPLEVPHA